MLPFRPKYLTKNSMYAPLWVPFTTPNQLFTYSSVRSSIQSVIHHPHTCINSFSKWCHSNPFVRSVLKQKLSLISLTFNLARVHVVSVKIRVRLPDWTPFYELIGHHVINWRLLWVRRHACYEFWTRYCWDTCSTDLGTDYCYSGVPLAQYMVTHALTSRALLGCSISCIDCLLSAQ